MNYIIPFPLLRPLTLRGFVLWLLMWASIGLLLGYLLAVLGAQT